MFSTTYVKEQIKVLVRQHESQEKAARQLGISPQYLSDILSGHREISESLAAKLGFNRVVRFVPKTIWNEEDNLPDYAKDLLDACRQLINAPHQEHFCTRLNDQEMAGLDAIKAALAKAEAGAA